LSVLLTLAAWIVLTPATSAGAAVAGAPIVAHPLPGLKADVAALLLSGRESGTLRAAVLAVPHPGEEAEGDGKTDVDVWVEIDGGHLLGEGETPESLRVEVHAYAMAEAGTLAGAFSQAFSLPLEEHGDALAAGGVKFAGRLRLVPGEHELRLLVRETRSQRFVLRVLPLAVPAPGGPYLGPPLFADEGGAWIPVRAAGDAAPANGDAPAALPVLAAGRTHTAWLWTSDPGARLAARLLDAERRPRTDVGVRPEAGAARPLAAAFEVPDLATGNYVLETSLDVDGRPSSNLPVYVLGAEFDAGGVAWTGIDRLAAEPERRREALDLAAKRRARKRHETIVRAYRGVLERLASGAPGEALDDLAHLEREALEATEDDARAALAAAQDEVVAGLAEAAAESLVPVLYLHMESHDRYAADKETFLTLHARERVIAVARRYAAGADARNELAPSLAASALSGMGMRLLRSRQPVAGRRMMEEALALDPRNATALLELALDDERHGEYAGAADRLRRLLAIRPRSDEGRLRLALNLRRGGQPREAARWLRRVIDDGTEDWLLALAYQELARLMIAEERPGHAVRLLEAGVSRLPRERRLAVQLAYALDRDGNGRRGRDVLDAALERADGSGPSPRLLYSRRPQGAVEDDRPALFRQSMARLAVLAGALGRAGEKR
jgi:tetratricopeptide (TPR) repeat protein